MKIISKTDLHATSHIKLVDIVYENKNGKESHWASAERIGGRKSVFMAIIVDDKLLVTKEYRVPIGDFEWSMPAGLIDGDEALELAAKRELKEETGLDLISVSSVSPFLYNTSGMTDESTAVLFGKASGNIAYDGLEESENIEAFLMNVDEVQELLNDSEKQFGAKAWLIFRQYVNGDRW